MDDKYNESLHDANSHPWREEIAPLILIAEDDDGVRHMIELIVARAGYRVIAAPDGEKALRLCASYPVDLVLLDVKMPVVDGYAVCRELRKCTHIPIVMLTAMSHTEDKINGIKVGADSYLTKPFSARELGARMAALLRRINQTQRRRTDHLLARGDITLDGDNHQAILHEQRINLTPNEYRLLRHLMRCPDRPIATEELLRAVWNYQACDDANLVRVTVRRLRRKIEKNPSEPCYLKTVYGIGYQFCANGGNWAEQLLTRQALHRRIYSTPQLMQTVAPARL
jgi:DNA-binding response OmpR family regulator